MVRRREALVFLVLLIWTGRVSACVCPEATVLSRFPSTVPSDACCLNLSGSALGHVLWFTNDTSLEILDLSHCNITQIELENTDRGMSSLTKLYLNHNRLTSLPKGFLSGLSNLTEVNLEGNLLWDLPEDFLQDSDLIQKLNLGRNRLRFLGASVLQKPELHILDIEDNPWDCSCEFLEEIEASRVDNRTTELHRLLANLTCSSPYHLEGRDVWGLRVRDVCRPTGLTALFIVLPLIILSSLVLCWCCGRKRSKKEIPAFSSKKKASSSHSNNHKPGCKPPPATDQSPKTEGILQNKLLLRPASALLSSTRDIYQEVEVRLGSVESLPQDTSQCSSLTDVQLSSQGPDGASRTELDALSVTEVMRDSADREKAYLTQSTEYYSLVPGLQLDDSDHGEYDNVDLT